MSKAKTSLSKPAKDEEEAVKFLATLAARIAPALCLNDPKRAIEDAARLFECAREKLERGQEGAPLARERAQLEADAERRDKYGFKLKGPNLSLADAFQLQKQERYWKGKRREGAYKRARDFFAALRRENLTWETFDGVEETTERALEELFERLREKRLAQDNASKKRGQEKK
jgi:hypothetical protein